MSPTQRPNWTRAAGSAFGAALLSCAGASNAPLGAAATPADGSGMARGAFSELAQAPAGGAPAGARMPSDRPIWLRLQSPERDLRLLAKAGLGRGQPFAALLEQPANALGLVVGAKLAAHADLAQPVDLLGSMTEQPAKVTLAFAVRDVPGLASAGVGLRELEEGHWALHPDEQAPEKSLGYCELWSSPPVARVICDARPSDLRAHAPFLLEAARHPATNASLRCEIAGEQLARQIAEDAEDVPANAAEAAGQQWAEDFGRHVERLAFELNLEEAGIQVGVDLAFSNEYAGGWIGDAPRELPQTFFRLPADADLSLGFSGLDSRLIGGALDQLIAFVRSQPEGQRAAPESVAEFRRNGLALLPRHGRFAFALGRDDAALRALVQRVDSRARNAGLPSTADLQHLDDAVSGWMLIGLEANSVEYLKSIEKALSPSPVATTPARVAPKTPAAELAKTTRRQHLTRLPAASGLPEGSLSWVEEVRPNARYVPPPGKLPALPHDEHYVAIPDGPRVWIAMARDPRLALARARAQLTASTPAPIEHEASAQDGRPLLAAGRVSLAAVAASFLDARTVAARDGERPPFLQLAALPHRGTTRWPLWLRLEPRASDSLQVLSLQAQLPPDVLADLQSWLATR